MIRNLKALGLALVAILAMGATAASTASAETEGTFTADEYPAHIVGKDTKEGHFKGIGGINFTCEVAEYTGQIAGGVHNLEITPNYEKCLTGTRTMTITHNKCTYTFYNATDTESGVTTPNQWTITTDLDCPGTNKVEIHIYEPNEHPHTKTWCTITIEAAKNKKLEGLTATNDTAAGHIELHGKVTVAAQTHGVCSAGLTLNVNTTLEITEATIEATDENGNPLGVEIS